MIIFLAEIAFGVLIYFQEAPYPNVIRDSVEATVTKKYHNNSTATTQTFDLIQEGVSLSICMYCAARKLIPVDSTDMSKKSKDRLRDPAF